MRRESEFYVGYLPMPSGLGKITRRVVILLGVLSALLAVALVLGQHPFPASTFEFQQYRDFQGTLFTDPYPALAIPGQDTPWLLVAPGKHGVGDLRRWNGYEVKLRGERIYRGDGRAGEHIIEILPSSLRVAKKGHSAPLSADLGEVRLTGEVVDSKCYFGVMNPGSG